MKTHTPSRRQSTLVLIGSIAALLSAPAAPAASLYWDTNGTTAGAGTTPTGTWAGSGVTWSTDNTTGTAVISATTTSLTDDLYFVAAPGATSGNGTYTVTVSGTQSAKSITTQSSGALTLSGGVINLGAGGITIPLYAYGTTGNAGVNISSTLNLTATQTWTLNKQLTISGNITGSGNILQTSNNSQNLKFTGGSSAGWTGSLTFDGGTLWFSNSQQLTTRLNSSTLTLKNNSASSYVLMQLDIGCVTNFTNNVTFAGTNTTNAYGFAISNGSAGMRGAVALMSGNLSGNLTSSLALGSGGADLSGTGQFGQIRLSGNNSGLTSSAALATSGSTIAIEGGYVVADNANALGTGNSLAVQLGKTGGDSTRRGFGLLASNGKTVASNITVAAAKSAVGGEAFLGLDGAGSAIYSGSVKLTSAASYVDNLHLRALTGGTATFSGNISDTAGNTAYVPVIVDGGGTVVLTGTNTYAGQTIVNSGNLNLDFSARTAVSNIINAVANNSALALGGGTLNLIGKDSTANSQRFNGTSFNTGASTVKLSSAATSGSLALSLGALTRNAASTLDFVLPTGTLDATNGVTTTTTTVSSNVLVSAASNGVAYATVGGVDWASLNGSNVVALPVASYNTNSFNPTDNTDITGAQTPGSGITVNTLRFNDTNASSLNLSGVNTVSTGGILVTATTAASGATITGGSLQAGGGKELVFINNGKLAVNSTIVDNATASALTISGTGVTTLGGANTYTGVTTVNSGTLSVSNLASGGNLGSATSAVVLGDGGHKGALSYVGTTTSYTRGFTIGAGGGELDVANPGQTLTLTTNGIAQQSSTATYGNFTIGGAGNVTLSSGAILSLGYGGLIMNGSGLLTISTASTYTGDTVINSGTVQLGVAGAVNTTSAIIINGGTLDISTYNLSRSATVTLNGGVIKGTSLFYLGSTTLYATSGTISAAINDTGGSLYKSGAGTLLLTANNSYGGGGATTVHGGTLALGSSSSLGYSATITVGDAGSTGAVLDLTAKGGFTISASQTAAGIGNWNLGAGNTLTANGHWAPGNSIGTNSVTGNLTLGSTDSADFQLGDSTSGTSDRTTVTGTLALGGTLTLLDNANNGGLGNAGAGAYQIFTASKVTGAFSAISNIAGYHAKVDTATAGSVYVKNYQIASASITSGTTVDLGHTHVGKSFTSSTVSIQNTATSTTYSEGLDAVGTASGDATVNGSVSNLAGTGTSTAISVGLNNDTAGAKSGTVTIGFASNGTVSGTSNTTLASQSVAVSGAVYNYAAANTISSTGTVNLGITHVSGTFSDKSLSIQNTAASGSYTEGLNASGTASGVATVSGSISNLSGQDISTAISVGLGGNAHTGSVGIVSGTVAVGLVSSGSNSGLDDTALDTQNLTVTGQVNNYANPIFSSETVGELGGSGTSYTLTLGTYTKNGDGSLNYSTTLTLANTTVSDPLYQDLLAGKLTLSSGANVTDLVLSDSSVSLESGSSVSLILSFKTTGSLTSGTYSAGMLTLNGTSVNSSEMAPLSNVNVDLNFVVVPEPSTWAMLVGGLGMLAFGQRLRRRMS